MRGGMCPTIGGVTSPNHARPSAFLDRSSAGRRDLLIRPRDQPGRPDGAMSGSVDVLSDVLRAVRLTGTIAAADQ